eukprot:TRINITY_DN50574_c0_g1_i1.p1 TRINITY_DN50574_c0_g1~~TRINITY_DN50574_c0_g1_i1.p1  ORF type:complete len:122 (-),score=7.12 TRINITY_DN50574_c0_g1_i1:25-390(-)
MLSTVISCSHPWRKPPRTSVNCDRGLRSRVVNPVQSARKPQRNFVTFERGLRSIEVRPEHPLRKSERTSVTCDNGPKSVSYTHLRAHETPEHLVCRLLLEKKNNITHAAYSIYNVIYKRLI